MNEFWGVPPLKKAYADDAMEIDGLDAESGDSDDVNEEEEDDTGVDHDDEEDDNEEANEPSDPDDDESSDQEDDEYTLNLDREVLASEAKESKNSRDLREKPPPYWAGVGKELFYYFLGNLYVPTGYLPPTIPGYSELPKPSEDEDAKDREKE